MSSELLICVLSLSISLVQCDQWITQRFRPLFVPSLDLNGLSEFQNLAYDIQSDNFYVGGTNFLYHLNSSLQLKKKFKTGPDLDSPYCNYNGDCTAPNIPGNVQSNAAQRTINKTLTNNFNQVLVISKNDKVIIVCGTLKQGICSVHLLDDVDKIISSSIKQTPVAANTDNATTAAFIGPGPNNQTVLYVGAAYTYESYRSDFPAVCSRSLKLDRLFQLDYQGVTAQSAMIIKSENRMDFRIWYIDGFYSEGFAYWAVVQKQSLDHGSPYVSKLLRVCSEDSRYESYSEIPLECKGPDNLNYNILRAGYVGKIGDNVARSLGHGSRSKNNNNMYFVGVFVRGDYPTKYSSQSAVCLYSLKDIRSAFWYNVERCTTGLDYWNLPHFGLTQKCHNFTTVPQDYCHHIHVGGTLPAISIASVTFADTVLSSVTMDVVGAHTVLLAGTAEGKVKKILLDSVNSGREYAEVTLGSTSINADMFIGKDRRHFYAMTNNEVLKVKLEDCASYSSCDTCLSSGDPYCGWCTLENRCSTKGDCPQIDKPYGFISIGGQCPRIELLHPLNASLYDDSDLEVALEFNFLPPPPDGGLYRCLFNNEFVPATFVSPKSLKCSLPSAANRPRVPDDKDHVAVSLKIWSSVSSAVFHETKFVFYDCTYHQLCTTCVASRWPCDWCLQDSKCVHDAGLCSSNQVLIRHGHRKSHVHLHAITKTNTSAPLPVSQCPHIDSHVMPEVLLPDSYPTSISVAVVNLDKLPNLSFNTLLCITIAEGREIRVQGKLSEDKKIVKCDEYAYYYNSKLPSSLAKFHLQTEGGVIIDRLNVQLFKCQLLASDCSRCLTMNSIYQCTWCDGQCQFKSSCPIGTVATVENPSAVCPAPEILSVTPSAGPIEGGTIVEIRGRDLGSKRRDVEDRVFVAEDVPCDVIEYDTAERIICITQKTSFAKSGAVRVNLDGRRRGESDISFDFVNPVIEGFQPAIGPKSGGTRISIWGRHLLDATKIQVYFGNIPCIVEGESTANTLYCATSESPIENLTLDSLTVVLDKANRTWRGPFTYTSDPKVSAISPAESFKSGGRQLFVRGQFFTSVLKPLMYVIDRSGQVVSESSICQVINSTSMICPSPPLKPTVIKWKRNVNSNERGSVDQDDQKSEFSDYDRFEVGFVMDGVPSVRRLPPSFGLVMVPDPVYENFPNGKKLHRGDQLILEGRMLHLASAFKDVRIMVGEQLCNVTMIAPTQVVCQMAPRVGPSNEPANPPVSVRVGNLNFNLGQLVYESDGAASLVDMTLVGSLVGACATLLLILVVAAAVWWRKKSWQAEREYKRIQLQMDTLESNVRQECKQAFAELQTDMSDLTGDLVPLNIPYHDRSRYAAKILFKEEHQAALQMLDWRQCNGNGYSNGLQSSVNQFELLLWNRQFVLVMVDCLESQSTFSAQDRVYVGSLLTAALSKNMQYLTDIVISLLRCLINRAATEKHPQLMLRRTESVVEKMLANWIALCLYDYLQETPGQALFLMFKALKHQVEKGPVDAVSADARYSLSEDRLLKEVLESEPVLLRVIPPQCDVIGGETILCRVLNCDTVTQVKSKIFDTLYRNAPYSTRPSIHDFDLEWRSPGPLAGSILLSDDDPNASPPGKDGWRQLRTIQYYKLPNHAIVAVLPKSRESFSYSSGSTHTYASINSSTYLLAHAGNGCSNGGGRRSPPENLEYAIRYWHLVKPDEHSGQRGGSIPEIYLTRLLATKGTVQQFIDDFFVCALKVGPGFPSVIKYLFDVLEEEANRHGITDPGVVYAWKNNSLPLRFWVNIIKNPDFVFDVEKSSTVDACLSVVAQTFMDSCSVAEQRLGKDSPSNKLLFARDSSRYRELFGKFYSDIQSKLPSVSDQDMNVHMTQLSKAYEGFNADAAVRELFAYAVRYKEQVFEALNSDQSAQRFRLAERFEQSLTSVGR